LSSWKAQVVLVVALVSMLVTLGSPAQAANKACFDWNCWSGATGYCTFDASCSDINNGTLWKYRWQFDTGWGYVLTGSPTTSYFYDVTTHPQYAHVTMKIFTLDTGDDPEVTCEIRTDIRTNPPTALEGRCE